MPNISVDYHDNAVMALLTRAPNDMGVAMRGGMEDSTTLLLAIAKNYPPAPPHSSYTRTHTLERSWGRSISGSGLNQTGRVYSNGFMAPYNRVVMDATR